MAGHRTEMEEIDVTETQPANEEEPQDPEHGLGLETDEEHLLGNGNSENEKTNKCDTNCIATTSVIVFITLIIIALFIGVFFWQKNLENEKHTTVNQCISERYLILISMDGFKHSYLTNNEWKTEYNVTTPTIDMLINNGAYIKQVTPVYPSQTFPNHLSIVTGLYPGYHGIIANSFYDPIYQEWFTKRINDTKGEWYRGEAIWQTMKNKANMEKFKEFKMKKSGTVMWVGTDKNVSGNGYPDNFLYYNHSMTFDERIDRTINLLKTKEYRLLVLYFDQPDADGHNFGPNSFEVGSKVVEMDGYLNKLVQKIKDLQNGFWDNTDIMLISDHGMKTVSNETILIENTTEFDLINDIDNFIVAKNKNNMFITLTDNATLTINETINLFKENTFPNDKYNIYTKDNIPYHFKNGYNNRIPDIIAVADIGYMFEFSNFDRAEQWWIDEKGSHGWNNSEIDMQAIFIGHGPSFKKGKVMENTRNVNFYELMCQVMCGLIPSKNNGSLNEIKDILDVSYDIY